MTSTRRHHRSDATPSTRRRIDAMPSKRRDAIDATPSTRRRRCGASAYASPDRFVDEGFSDAAQYQCGALRREPRGRALDVSGLPLLVAHEARPFRDRPIIPNERGELRRHVEGLGDLGEVSDVLERGPVQNLYAIVFPELEDVLRQRGDRVVLAGPVGHGQNVARPCVEIKCRAPHAVDATVSPQLRLHDGVEAPRPRRDVLWIA